MEMNDISDCDVLHHRRPGGRTVPSGDDVDSTVDVVLHASQLLLAMTTRATTAVTDTITFPQLRLMMLLRSRGSRTVGGLARSVGLHPSTVSRTVKKLTDSGWVFRKTDPHLRRGTLIVLTQAGQDVVNTVLERRRYQIAQTVQRMSPIEQRELMWAMNTLAQFTGSNATASSETRQRSHSMPAQSTARLTRGQAGAVVETTAWRQEMRL